MFSLGSHNVQCLFQHTQTTAKKKQKNYINNHKSFKDHNLILHKDISDKHHITSICIKVFFSWLKSKEKIFQDSKIHLKWFKQEKCVSQTCNWYQLGILAWRFIKWHWIRYTANPSKCSLTKMQTEINETHTKLQLQ